MLSFVLHRVSQSRDHRHRQPDVGHRPRDHNLLDRMLHVLSRVQKRSRELEHRSRSEELTFEVFRCAGDGDVREIGPVDDNRHQGWAEEEDFGEGGRSG